MTQFASDSFTGASGTELSAYSGVWSKASGWTGDIVISNDNRARAASTNNPRYDHSATPASADYTASIDVVRISTAGVPHAFVVVRSQSGANTYYAAGWQETSGSTEGLSLTKRVAGTLTTIVRDTTISFAGSSTVLLDVSGASPSNALDVYYNGVLEISTTDASAIDSAGKAGIGFTNTSAPGDSTTYHIDNFSADEVGGGATDLTIQDAVHAHAADNLTLSIVTVTDLTIADAVHAHTADNLSIVTVTDLTIADAVHGHAADSPTITVASTLAIQDATHAHTADSLALTLDTTLTIADATHGHTADNLTIGTSGAVNLTIDDATHGHTADSPTLTLGYVDLVIAEALHAHTADSLTLTVSGSVNLLIANALHAHLADTPTPSPGYIDLTIADALHGHTADSLTLGGLYSDLELILKILSNRQELNAGTGTFTVYDDDSVSVLFTASAWADAAGTTPYSGGTLGRIDALA